MPSELLVEVVADEVIVFVGLDVVVVVMIVLVSTGALVEVLGRVSRYFENWSGDGFNSYEPYYRASINGCFGAS